MRLAQCSPPPHLVRLLPTCRVSLWRQLAYSCNSPIARELKWILWLPRLSSPFTSLVKISVLIHPIERISSRTSHLHGRVLHRTLCTIVQLKCTINTIKVVNVTVASFKNWKIKIYRYHENDTFNYRVIKYGGYVVGGLSYVNLRFLKLHFPLWNIPFLNR